MHAGNVPRRNDEAEQSARARDEAVRYLAARSRTVAEVRQRLLRRGYAPALVDDAVGELVRLKLLDDEATARSWLQWAMRTRPVGAARAARELRRRGIAAEIVQRVVDQSAAELDAETRIAALLRRQRWRYASLDRDAARRRMLAFLARRGYDQEASWKAVEQVWGEWQRDESERNP